jgi:hypothetical protein
MYGDLLLPWRSFIRTLGQLQSHELLRQSSNLTSNPASFYDDIKCYRTLKSYAERSSSNPSISKILGLARPKLTTKPEDKVYGLYGIFDHLQIKNLLKVDYNRPVYETYTEIAMTAIKSEQPLDILYHVCLPQLIPLLPSWVPDWSNATHIRRICIAYSNAAGSSLSSYSFNDRQLSVKGILIDEIDQVATSTSIAMASFRHGYNARMDVRETDKRYNGVIELVRTLQAWIELGSQLRVYPTAMTPLKAWFRVLTQNSLTYDGLPSSLAHSSAPDTVLNKWMHIMTTNEPIELETLHKEVQNKPDYIATITDYAHIFGCGTNLEAWPTELQRRFFLRLARRDVASLQHDIFLNSYHKTLVITKDGYMGTCPRWAEPGDSVVLISGLRTPFVVRKDGQDYRLIGPAYIAGVMNGERWDENQARSFTFH